MKGLSFKIMNDIIKKKASVIEKLILVSQYNLRLNEYKFDEPGNIDFPQISFDSHSLLSFFTRIMTSNSIILNTNTHKFFCRNKGPFSIAPDDQKGFLSYQKVLTLQTSTPLSMSRWKTNQRLFVCLKKSDSRWSCPNLPLAKRSSRSWSIDEDERK